MVLEPKFVVKLWKVYFKLYLKKIGDTFDYLDAPVSRVSHMDIPMPYSLPLEEATSNLTPHIVSCVKKMLLK